MSNAVLEQWKRAAEGYKVAKGIAEKLAASLKPLGYYNIPELLDQRRLEYGIPNGAFESAPLFDKCYIWQIPLPGQGGENYEGTSLIKPEQVQSWERNTAPRGILVGAGLQAMDALYSTGCEIGHIVRIKKLSPFIMPVDQIDGKPLSVMIIRDGDIESSEDLAKALNERRASVKNISKKRYDFRVCQGDVVSHQKKPAFYDSSM